MTTAVSSYSIHVFTLLVNMSVGAAILLSVAWLLSRVSGSSAAFRCLIWNSTMAALLLLPLLFVMVPARFSVSQLDWGTSKSLTPLAPTRAAALERNSPSPVPGHPASLPLIESTGEVLWAPTRSVTALVIASFWVLGMLRMLGRFTASRQALATKESRTDLEPEWNDAAIAAATKLSLSGAVVLIGSSRHEVPAVLGARLPLVFLPHRPGWSFERRLAILLHEFAHINRKDLYGVWLKQLVSAMYWFHPLVAIAIAECRKDYELACDDLVLATGLEALRVRDASS